MGQPGGDPNRRGNSRRWIVQEVENSLRRLQTDWIDLYQVHRPEPDTDIEETLSALTDLQRRARSARSAPRRSRRTRSSRRSGSAERRGLGRFVTEQPPYSMLARGIEADLLPVAERVRHGRPPLEPAGRRLAHRALPQGPGRSRVATRASGCPARYDLSTPANQRKLEAADALARLAEEAGLSLIHLALAFVARAPGRDRPDHRAAHDGAARVPARRRRRHAVGTTCSTGSTRSCRPA